MSSGAGFLPTGSAIVLLRNAANRNIASLRTTLANVVHLPVPISNEITETYITVIANSHPGKKEMEVNQNRKVDKKHLKAGNNMKQRAKYSFNKSITFCHVFTLHPTQAPVFA